MFQEAITSFDAEQNIWSGPREHHYFAQDLSVGEIIFNEMRRHPNKVAQISATEHTVLTRDELLMNAMRVACYMRQLGLKQSDIVCIIARNTTHIAAVAYACFFNGIAFHALNVAYEKDTIEKLVNITKPKLLFCDGDEYTKILEATSELSIEIITMRNHRPNVTNIQDVLLTAVQQNFQPTRLDQGNNQTLAILCSSGTTGTPKAVTITNSRKIFISGTALTTADVQYSHSSLDWITGLLTLVTTAVFSTKRIIVDSPFDPTSALRIIQGFGVTWLLQPPSHMAMMTNSPEFGHANLNTIRCYLYGGDRCSLDVQHQIRSRLRQDCLHFAYGFTELGTMSNINFHFDKKPNSVGCLLPGFRLKIIDEQNKCLGPNEMGEVCIFSGQYWAGYYNNPKESQGICDAALWFHTGDMGYMDNDGYLYILERKKRMLKYMSIMYYPNDIEEIILQMPGVADVCVFGVWNKFIGDEAAAAVVKSAHADFNAQDVVEFVARHVDAKYKQLSAGAIIMKDLCRSANGKTNPIATKAYFLKSKETK